MWSIVSESNGSKLVLQTDCLAGDKRCMWSEHKESNLEPDGYKPPALPLRHVPILVGMTGIGPVLTAYQTVFLPLKDIPVLVPPEGIAPTRAVKQRIYSPLRLFNGLRRHIMVSRTGLAPASSDSAPEFLSRLITPPSTRLSLSPLARATRARLHDDRALNYLLIGVSYGT